jgi:hypothetical protein
VSRTVTLSGALIPAALAALIASAALAPASAREHRSRKVTREFQREQPCPSTGAPRPMPRLYQGSHHAARLWLALTRWRYAVADGRRGQGQGSVGAPGLSVGNLACAYKPTNYIEVGSAPGFTRPHRPQP